MTELLKGLVFKWCFGTQTLGFHPWIDQLTRLPLGCGSLPSHFCSKQAVNTKEDHWDYSPHLSGPTPASGKAHLRSRCTCRFFSTRKIASIPEFLLLLPPLVWFSLTLKRQKDNSRKYPFLYCTAGILTLSKNRVAKKPTIAGPSRKSLPPGMCAHASVGTVKPIGSLTFQEADMRLGHLTWAPYSEEYLGKLCISFPWSCTFKQSITLTCLPDGKM